MELHNNDYNMMEHMRVSIFYSTIVMLETKYFKVNITNLMVEIQRYAN